MVGDTASVGSSTTFSRCSWVGLAVAVWAAFAGGCADDTAETGGAGGGDVGGAGSGGAPHGPPEGAASLALGSLGSCVVEDDTGSMWCWGWNQNGQFGTRASTQFEIPYGVYELGPIRLMELSGDFGCAVVEAPLRVVCRGYDHGGTDQDALTGVDVVGLALGFGHVCALVSDGTVQCWGENSGGQLGDGTLQGRMTAAPVPGLSNVRQIAGGADHTCAVLEDGTVECWGDDVSTPTPVAGLTNIQAIALSGGADCALDDSGAVYCYGQFGDCLANGSDSSCPEPTLVPGLSGMIDIGVGDATACARDSSGAVICWGENGRGQLGDGTLTANYTPTEVALPTAVTDMDVGDDHVCAYASGHVYCWGSNGNGQIGNGTTIDQLTPLEVQFP
ncbi:MAG: hypothetical protein U0271_17815 [Polyangiaceae bacterium]